MCGPSAEFRGRDLGLARCVREGVMEVQLPLLCAGPSSSGGRRVSGANGLEARPHRAGMTCSLDSHTLLAVSTDTSQTVADDTRGGRGADGEGDDDVDGDDELRVVDGVDTGGNLLTNIEKNEIFSKQNILYPELAFTRSRVTLEGDALA
ncbi:hypothetical protein L1049_027110 [Liquidambar formosana]|uniref:Uncharacterized protein n=1 Tax=Liquidambar formosana TaxID=63359 RepID=A0AAP0R5W2_LIQFO